VFPVGTEVYHRFHGTKLLEALQYPMDGKLVPHRVTQCEAPQCEAPQCEAPQCEAPQCAIYCKPGLREDT